MKKYSDSIYMAIPNSDFDKINWIKANDIEEASEKLSKSLDLNYEELRYCEYRIFQVPNKEIFEIFKIDQISRASTNFGEYKDFWD